MSSSGAFDQCNVNCKSHRDAGKCGRIANVIGLHRSCLVRHSHGKLSAHGVGNMSEGNRKRQRIVSEAEVGKVNYNVHEPYRGPNSPVSGYKVRCH